MESKTDPQKTGDRNPTNTPALRAAGALDRLHGRARELAQASLSENTRLAYQGALQRLSDALAGRPPTDARLAAYLTSLHEGGKSPAVAAQVVAAVRFQARLMGQETPVGPASERVLAGIRREGRERGRGQVAGITWNQADTVAAVASNDGGKSLAGLRDAAIVSLMSDALLRVGELAVLQVEDIAAVDDGTARLTIRHSKTDQEAAGSVQFIGASTLRRIRAWMDGAGIESGPLFRRVRRGDRVIGSDPLTVQAIRQIIKGRAAAADLEGRFSGHSLRVGAAQSLAAAGASVVEMQTAGRWQSPSMPGRYARGELAARGAVARLRYGK